MNRRAFMVALGLAPGAAVLPAAAKALHAGGPASSKDVQRMVGEGVSGMVIPSKPISGGMRISCLKDDPGYRAWCMLRGDGKTAKVYLDGVEQKDACIADEAEGMVRRAVRTPEGNLAIGRDEVLEETVYGDVHIEIA